jgi:hypothetical protein
MADIAGNKYCFIIGLMNILPYIPRFPTTAQHDCLVSRRPRQQAPLASDRVAGRAIAATASRSGPGPLAVFKTDQHPAAINVGRLSWLVNL